MIAFSAELTDNFVLNVTPDQIYMLVHVLSTVTLWQMHNIKPILLEYLYNWILGEKNE